MVGTHVANIQTGHDSSDGSGCTRHDDGSGDGKGFKGVARGVEAVLFARSRRCWGRDGARYRWGWGSTNTNTGRRGGVGDDASRRGSREVDGPVADWEDHHGSQERVTAT